MKLIDLIPEADRPLLLTTGVAADAIMATAMDQGCGVIELPRGLLLFSATLHLKRRVHLMGEGGGLAGDTVSTLRFAPNTLGIVVHRHNTGPSGIEDPTTPADGTILEGLALSGSGTSGHGIDLHARAMIRGCLVDGFGGNGINIVADSAVDTTNANCWGIDSVRVTNCDGHGLFVDGGDANAGNAVALDCTSNGGWGIFDSSFLGNTYIGCHVAANALGAYKTDSANARNVFLGCYSESGQPASVFAAPTLIVGGLHGAGLSGGQFIGDGKLSPFSVKGTNAARTVNYRLGQFDSAGLDIVASGDHPHGWSLGWWDEASKTVQARHARVASRVPFSLTTDMSTSMLDEAGAPIGPGKMVMQGAWVKLPSGRYRFVDFAAL